MYKAIQKYYNYAEMQEFIRWQKSTMIQTKTFLQAKGAIILYMYILGALVLTPSSYSSNNAGSIEWDTVQSNTSLLASIFSIESLINVFFAITVVFGAVILAKVISSKISGFIQSKYGWGSNNAEEMSGMLSRTISIIFLVVGFTTGLSIVGVDLGIFMGGIGFGLWFTLKTFLTNFVWGIMMVTQDQYHNGDLIEVQGKMGNIVQIHSLFTAIEQFDGVVFYIPNVVFMEEAVSNYKTNDKRRVEVDVGVDYTTDLVQAKKICLQVLEKFPNILKAPASDVLVEKFWDNSVWLKIRFWLHSEEDYFQTKSHITETVHLAFKQTGIVIAFPQVTLSYRDTKNVR